MKLLRIYCVAFTAVLTIVIFNGCEPDPIEHGTEYVLRVADGSDTAATRKTFMVIGNRLNNFDLDGDYEISMTNGDIHVRLREGVAIDQSRLRSLLQASAGLTFRITYGIGELGDQINSAHTTYLQMNNVDSAQRAETKLFGHLLPADYTNPSSPVLGYCLSNDTSTVSAFLRHDSIVGLFPFDLVFHWGKGIPDANGFETYALLTCRAGRNYELSGEHVANAISQYNEQSGSASPEISITFDQSGSDEWAKMTKTNIGKSIAIELDNFVYSYPIVQSEITGGQAVITGNFTDMEAQDLAMLLNAGQMPSHVKIVEEKTF